MRPITTLFLIESLDGKISTGDTDQMDVDKDYPKIIGIKEGLHQYYEIEGKTDWVSFGSGKVQAKIGVNERPFPTKKDDVCFVMVDNEPHLNEHGVEYFAQRSPYFYLITTNASHPAFAMQEKYPIIRILFYSVNIDFVDAFRKLKEEYYVEKMTIQSGGELNAELIRNGLINKVMIVIAPALIGGRNTATLVDGESLHTESELNKIKALELTNIEKLDNSYICLHYDVINKTETVQS